MLGSVGLRQKARRLFLKNSPAPWTCTYCLKDVVRNDMTVHHVDEDLENCTMGNLEPMHRSCHSKHHHTGKALTPEHRAKLSAAKVGKPSNSKGSKRPFKPWSQERRRRTFQANVDRTLGKERK